MKAVFATVILSILSAIGAVYAVTQLCVKASVAGNSNDSARSATSEARPYPRQKLQQWVNH